jgi:hypothetical protein
MADPAIVACTAGQWTKVATNQTAGVIHILTGNTGQIWLQTYRATGGGAPTLRTEGVVFGKDTLSKQTETINAAAGVDVYVWPDLHDGSVRVDV